MSRGCQRWAPSLLTLVAIALGAACSEPTVCPRAPETGAAEPAPRRHPEEGPKREAPLPITPYVVVLGTAQDGGLPQIGCDAEACRRARRDAAFRRLVTSVMVCDPKSGSRWLLDASPDLREQVARAEGHPPSRAERPAAAGRPPLFDGIFLSHAHMGHYTGLMFLGREAYGSAETPVYGSARMTSFLRDNGPWSLLVKLGHISLHELAPSQPLSLAPSLSIEPIAVVHRDELSDTVAFVLRGPTRSLLYLPDIDKWDRWDRRIETVLAGVDVALIDGTFFAADEIPGRDMAEIPHPFIVESLKRFAPLPAAERAKIHFTHLNHTNTAADPRSPAARRVAEAGMTIAREMQVFSL